MQAWRSYEQQRFSNYLHSPILLSTAKEATISTGSTVSQAARTLADAGVIEAAPFVAAITRLGLERKVQAGHYRFATGISHQDVIDSLISGKVLRWKFRLIEGTTFAVVLSNLRATERIGHTVSALPDSEVWAQIARDGGDGGPEGMLLPDTYLYSHGDSDSDILANSHARLLELLDEMWAARSDGLPLASPYQALILASIIEKETGQASERPLIASVFINRLRKGMRLQSDPTVIYGMGDKFNGNLRKADLRADTPYNTYTRAGLPPTPIAMASKTALQAALHPAASDYLYFVANGNGGHKFSKSLREHINAVNRYQKKRQQ